MTIALREYRARTVLYFGIATMLFATMFFVIPNHKSAQAQTSNTPLFNYQFMVNGTLSESGTPEGSSSPYWWLASGGKLILENGVGKTIHGELPSNDPMRIKYATAMPVPSDNGFHPQNLFRLLTKKTWQNVSHEATFLLSDVNVFNQENSQPYNGLFLVSRYTNDNNFYTAGIRFDGSAVIKKKQNGAYTTLVQKNVYGGEYNRVTTPNLLPLQVPIALRMTTVNGANGQVTVTLSRYNTANASWELLASATDAGSPLTTLGRIGVFGDYLEFSLDNFIVRDASSISAPVQSSISTTTPAPTPTPAPAPAPSPAPSTSSGLTYGLSANVRVVETGTMTESGNSSWWVNSGAYFDVQNGIGRTIQGSLPAGDQWRTIYASANPLDTDNGLHPQNIFRLLTKSKFKNVSQQLAFRINEYHESASPNRDGHNGFLFFNRYVDGQNLYYTGIRVDGKAIIKKKQNGRYYTLASRQFYSGTYNRTSNTNVIPEDTWIGLKSEVIDNPNGSVSIKVYIDRNNDGNWALAAEAIDNGSTYGPIIQSSAYTGIRTDFMDADFQNYRVREL